MNFSNKVVLITGASRGIGMSVAKAFVKYKAKVIGTANTVTGLYKIKECFNKRIASVQMCLSDKDSIIKSFNIIRKTFNSIDILINNAGICKDKLLIHMKEEDWISVINVNLISLFLTSKLVIKDMIKKKFGRIINISSVTGDIGNIGQTNYSSAKAGVVGFSKSLAKEVAKYGVTVNVVSPGFIDTDMTNSMNEKQILKIKNKIPIQRFGSTKEVANAVIFLASTKASYITGETLNVNGGLYMK